MELSKLEFKKEVFGLITTKVDTTGIDKSEEL